MNDKRTISARETYVLDDELLDELDQASLTGVMRDVTRTMERPASKDEDPPDAEDRDPFGWIVPED